MNSLNAHGQQLAQHLLRLESLAKENKSKPTQADKVHVVGAGGALTAAYEQLRNAAENTEEHLLLQNAIRRFYRQLFVTRDESLIARSGQELTVELTLAGYIANDSLTEQQIEQISDLAKTYYRTYSELLRRQNVPSTDHYRWTLDVLAVEAEAIINDSPSGAVFIDFAYHQLEQIIDKQRLGADATEDYGAALYIAIHQSLLKSDLATIRTGLLKRYQVSVDSLDQYITVNQKINQLLGLKAVDKLRRIVDRQGAPFRILRRMINERDGLADLMYQRDKFLQEFENTVIAEYERTERRINKAIVRSVIFLIITKVLIGVAIEVPYDLWAHGEILWLPLAINLLFPPLYMVALRVTHRLPSSANTTALIDRIDHMLYGEAASISSSRTRDREYGAAFSAVYVISGILIFAAVTYGLLLLQFSLVHIVIFFVFLSAASFLGFRLSRFIRELEVVRSAQNGITFVRDLLYLPFVVVGQWMSDKYSRVNIVTIVLDMLIELPLKTLLRLIRQWNAFIDDRKDSL